MQQIFNMLMFICVYLRRAHTAAGVFCIWLFICVLNPSSGCAVGHAELPPVNYVFYIIINVIQQKSSPKAGGVVAVRVCRCMCVAAAGGLMRPI